MTSIYSSQTFIADDVKATHGLKNLYRAEQVLAVTAIALLLPFAAAIAIAIFIKSRRGPLVRHWRVGWRGVPLGVLKFRTMWNGSESPSTFFSIEEISSGTAPPLKTRVDSRVTNRFAAFCRRHSLDEIPQLYHVAKGEMSLVGPRPLTAMELTRWYGPAASTILTLRPGLTGLWQVKGRNRLTYPQRKRLDLFLARHSSAGLYLQILLGTMPRIFLGDDAW